MRRKIYMLLSENAALGLRPRAAFSRPRSQFFTIRADPKPVNNLLIFSKLSNEKKNHGKKLTQALLWPWSEIGKSALRTNQIVGFVTVPAWKKINDFLIDHRSYTHNLSSCKIKAWKSSNIWSFMYSFASFIFYGYITNSQSDQLPDGLIAQNIFQALISQLLKLCV